MMERAFVARSLWVYVLGGLSEASGGVGDKVPRVMSLEGSLILSVFELDDEGGRIGGGFGGKDVIEGLIFWAFFVRSA
jgi:hypothetical protein